MRYIEDDKMSTIRTLVLIAFIGALMLNSMLLAIGGFAIGNSIPLPANVSQQYNAIIGNKTQFSILGGIQPLNNKIKNAENTTQNSTFISGSITIVAITTNMWGAISNAYQLYVNFIGAGLSVINPVLVTYANTIAIVIIIALLILSIASAIMLFPI